MMTDAPLLEVEDLSVRFSTRHGEVEAISDVSFTIDRGETVCVVGESGSGKSVTALAILGLLGRGRITGGSIRFDGRDLSSLTSKQLRAVRGDDIAMIFQDPMTSLDPLYSIGNQLTESLRLHRDITRKEARRRAAELLDQVGLPDPEQRLRSYPHQLSGGQRQRVMVAIALACSPRLLIADEPTTALDVTVEAQILKMMADLQEEYGSALMMITHDMGVVAEVADRVVGMYAGRVIEQGPVRELLADPRHPYTEALIKAIPAADTPRDEPLSAIRGAVPSLFNTPSGCRFHPRCPYAWERCTTEEPPMLEVPGGRLSRCWIQDPQEPGPAMLTQVEPTKEPEVRELSPTPDGGDRVS